MWYFIFAAMFIAMIVGIIYLSSRFYKLSIVEKMAKGKKSLRKVFAFLPVLIAVGVCYFVIGLINTAIVLVHTLCIWILIDVVNGIIQKIRKKKSNYNVIVPVGILILLVYFFVGWYSAHHVVGVHYNVATEKNVGKLRVVQITDSHVGATFNGEGFAKEMKKVQKEKPDVVVVTGDFVDDDTTKEDMIRSCEALGELDTPYGVYFVFGNHDKGYYSDEVRGYGVQDIVSNLEKNGVTVLEDENVLIADNYYIIGRQDKSEEMRGNQRADMASLTKGLDKSKYMIVLDHQPNDFKAQEESKVDLVLSGHTHGGQFFPINYLGELTGQNDMTYGIRKNGDTTFEVSSGISDWAIKFKTGCKAEYVILDIGA